MKKAFRTCGQVAIPLILVAFVLLVIFHKDKENEIFDDSAKVQVAKSLRLEAATTQEERERGLQGHSPLEEGEGLVLVFDQPQKICLWNRGVNFPISVGFLGGDRKLLGHLNLDANSEVKKCFPVPAQFAIEAKLGTFDKLK